MAHHRRVTRAPGRRVTRRLWELRGIDLKGAREKAAEAAAEPEPKADSEAESEDEPEGDAGGIG